MASLNPCFWGVYSSLRHKHLDCFVLKSGSLKHPPEWNPVLLPFEDSSGRSVGGVFNIPIWGGIAYIQTYRQTDRQTYIQTEIQTNIRTYNIIHLHTLASHWVLYALSYPIVTEAFFRPNNDKPSLTFFLASGMSNIHNEKNALKEEFASKTQTIPCQW